MDQKYEQISFLFVTATSGSFDRLMERAGLTTREGVVNQALVYYSYYVAGTYERGPILGKGNFDLDEIEFDKFDDARTADHVSADPLDLPVDMERLWELTRRARKKDPADTLTAALIVFEQICDAREAGLTVGHFDPKANKGRGVFTPLVARQRLGAAIAAPPPETVPPKWDLH